MITQFPSTFLPGQFKLAPGLASDYHALARFHYAPSPPATFAAVVCARWSPFDPSPREPGTGATPADKAPSPRRSASSGSKQGTTSHLRTIHAARMGPTATGTAAWHDFFDCFERPEDAIARASRLVGVLVLSYPSALNRTRHRVFGLRPIRFWHRLRWVNANLRTVSRVIIHPQFRGIGLSTALIRAAIDLCPTSLIEASARMGRAHPLFERAGFTRVDPLTSDEPVYYWRRRDPMPTRHSGLHHVGGPAGVHRARHASESLHAR